MRKTVSLAPVAFLLMVFAAGVLLPSRMLSAGEEVDLEKMISSAQTKADHEAIAVEYERRAAAADGKSVRHQEMEAEYKKIGGALIGKQHIDTHCQSLASLYKKVAAENAALAKAHQAMAKTAK